MKPTMSHEASDFAKAAAEKAGEAATKAKQFATDARDQARQSAGTAVHFSQDRIRENPFSTVLIALVAGIALGVLLDQACSWTTKTDT